MKVKNDKLNADIGVIVGRFQVPELHEAHTDLIQTVVDNHERVIIFLGLSPLKATVNNPLDYKSRVQMINKKFPDVDIYFIKDVPSDFVWSSNLDYQISDLIGPQQTVTLYGSRDSFITHYHGKHQTQELESDRIISGSEIRKQVSNKHHNSSDFRAGVIWATMNQFPSAIPTVDIAIVDKQAEGGYKVLLAKKPNEDKYRFIGGFANPEGNGFEEDAKRETFEETGLEVSNLQWVGSYPINDWRYRGEQNKIITTFFIGEYTHGKAKANDDISEILWVPLRHLNEQLFVDEHVILFKEILKNVGKF